MREVKFITFTDIHISDNNPKSRKGNYKEDILSKLLQIKMVGKKLGVDFFLCGGDLFNLKTPMRNSHRLTSELVELFKSFPGPVYSTEGNHDLRNDSYETFDEQPLNVIYKSEAMIQVRNELIALEGFGNIRLRSFPFCENPDLENLEKSNPDDCLSICMMHLYSTPDGGNLFKQKLYSYDEISTLGDDIFLMGHYHVDQGITKITPHGKPQYFLNVGSLSRGTLAEDDILRHPKICYVTIKKEDDKILVKPQAVKLKVKPVEEIFNIEEKKEEKKQIEIAEQFVDKMKAEIEQSEINTNNIDSEVDKLDTDQEVLDKVKHYLQEAHLVIDKVKQ